MLHHRNQQTGQGFHTPARVQLRGVQLGCQALPDRDGQVFRGRNSSGEFRHFPVQEAVIHCVQDFPVQNFLQLPQVHNETGARVHLTFDRDFKSVVMAVAVRVIAFTENAAILLRVKSGL